MVDSSNQPTGNEDDARESIEQVDQILSRLQLEEAKEATQSEEGADEFGENR